MKGKKSGRIVLSLGEEGLRKLGWLAKADERSRSSVVRRLIDREYEVVRIVAAASAAQPKPPSP